MSVINPHDIILRPIITEKASVAKEKTNKVVFAVSVRASKHAVKDAVEKVFKVSVEKVNMLNVKSKPRRFGRIMGRKPGYKKAVVTLVAGNNIEVFDQV
jgi:large subunit ribosomal protein L23